MKLKIKAFTNQNVSIDYADYPPHSLIECMIDTKHLPTYVQAFDEWEIIDPVVAEVPASEVKVTEVNKEDDKEQPKQVENQVNRQSNKKVRAKQS